MAKKEVPVIKNKDSDKPTEIAGYKAKDIAKAPFTSPELAETETKKYTQNKPVVILIIASVLFALLGILIILSNSIFIGLFFVVLAAVTTITAVFYPVK